jgi:enamine deaminase RidA (YjgF/YER057c/UK114 family)
MSDLQYTTPAGHGQDNLKNYRYNQVVRVGDVIHISGQGASDFSPCYDNQAANHH